MAGSEGVAACRLDPAVPQLHYNYRPAPELLDSKRSTDLPGHSFFLRHGDEIFHTYSAYGRGNEYTTSLYPLLDLSALGRQEAWKEPKGRASLLQDT